MTARLLVFRLVLGASLLGPLMLPADTSAPADLALRSTVAVGRDGVFLNELFEGPAAAALPHVCVAPAPLCGRVSTLSRAALIDIVRQHLAGSLATNWTPATTVQVTRRTRLLEEAELKNLLTEALQRETVKDYGELELRLPRPWTAVAVPDEPITLKVVDLPASGVSPNFIARFEVWNAAEKVGQWQLALQARVWREVVVARASLHRGQLLSDAQIATERRDGLPLRDALTPEQAAAPDLEVAEPVPAGRPLLARSVRVHPVLERGDLVEGVYVQGAMTIHLKVEALEPGVCGQTIRVRNPKTRREFQARVHNEESVVILL